METELPRITSIPVSEFGNNVSCAVCLVATRELPKEYEGTNPHMNVWIEVNQEPSGRTL